MSNGKPTTPKTDTAKPPSTRSTPAKKRSAASKPAESAARKTTPRARKAATQRPAADGVTGLTAHERHALVAQAAYFRAEARGFAAGGELEDWLNAEAEIAAQLANV